MWEEAIFEQQTNRFLLGIGSASPSQHSCRRISAIPFGAGREVFWSPGTPIRVEPGAVALALGPAVSSSTELPTLTPESPPACQVVALGARPLLPPGLVLSPQMVPHAGVLHTACPLNADLT